MLPYQPFTGCVMSLEGLAEVREKIADSYGRTRWDGMETPEQDIIVEHVVEGFRDTSSMLVYMSRRSENENATAQELDAAGGEAVRLLVQKLTPQSLRVMLEITAPLSSRPAFLEQYLPM
jgi:hypothetical protein